AHPHHVVFGFEQFGVLVAGECAVVALLTLGVEAPPTEAAPQIGFFDAVESGLGVDVFDAFTHVERGAGLLELFVGVQWFAISQRPLALTASLCGTGCGHSEVLLRGHGRRGCATHRLLRLAQIRRQLDVQVGGSTTSSQTATAADTLEIDMPPRHEGNAQAGPGGGHGPILPWMVTSDATRSNFSSR